MPCQRCGGAMEPDESHEHQGELICDDCFMDAMRPSSGCNPWASYTATRLGGGESDLVGAQKAIFDFVKHKGSAEVGELMAATGLGRDDLVKEVVPLRHMDLVRWERREEGDPLLKLTAS